MKPIILKLLLNVILLLGVIQLAAQTHIKVKIQQPNIEECRTTGVQTIPNFKALNVFPNPNSGSFLLEVEDIDRLGKLEIQIFDLLGKRIYQNQEQSNQNKTSTNIQLGHIPNGTYFLKVNNNQYQSVKKIIINN